MNTLDALFEEEKKRTKKDKLRSAKVNHKYRMKDRKWGLMQLKKGHLLFCGATTLCLDCGNKAYGHRAGCRCWTPNLDNPKTIKGVVYGIEVAVEVGNGLKTPVLKKVRFISYADLLIQLNAGKRAFNVSDKKEFFSHDFS